MNRNHESRLIFESPGEDQVHAGGIQSAQRVVEIGGERSSIPFTSKTRDMQRLLSC